MRLKAHLVSLVELLLVGGLSAAAPAMTTNVCASPAFAAAPVIAMGRTPASIKVLVQDEYVCFQFNISDNTVQWGSLAIASTPKMVGDTPYNVVILDVAAPPALLYTMKGYGRRETTVNSDQSPINVTQSTHINGVLSFTFQRRLAAVVDSDVAIDPSGVTTLTWAYDTKSFPSEHKASGALQLTLNAAHNANAPLNTLYTAVIAAGVFGVMLALGIVATYLGRFRLINYTTLCAPPKSDKGLAPLVQILADLKIGEGIIVLLFLGALVGASLYLQTPTPILNYASFAFISGHLSLLSLMFSLIPIARGPHWQHLFGSSHDRVLKFHRASSWLFVLFGLVHLVLYIPATSPASTQVYGLSAVRPIAGAFALVAGLSLVVASWFRRKHYARFYMHHRIASVFAFIFVVLHSTVIAYAMIVPLALYVLSGLFRVRAFCQTFDAAVQLAGPKTVTLTLPSTPLTKKWVATINPSSFYYLQVPSVSGVEWHPFTAVVTPDGTSIGFCIKAMTTERFADKLIADVVVRTGTGRATLPIVLGGPYGTVSVHLPSYQVVVLVAGGVGITPMLSTINQFRHKQGKPGAVFHLYWVVRDANDLLMAETLMYPLPESLVYRFYVTTASTEGSVHSASMVHQPYNARRPKWDELINGTIFVGKSVCVLACGPDPLTREVQSVARKYGFDFHKEEFAW